MAEQEQADCPPSLAPLPWHEAALAGLAGEAAADRLPQTLLLCAPTGTGLATFADALTAWLLCEQREGRAQACGVCRGCRQWLSGAHPDTVTLRAQGAGLEITVDAVREVIDTLSLTRHYAGYRVVRLHPAEALNRNAANALLKTLEEPTAGTVFLLLSEQPRSLPPTVRSRAQIRQLPMPGEAAAREWLQVQGCADIDAALELFPGQPLHALAQQEDITLTLYQSILDDIVKNPSQLSELARKVSDSREAALAFLNWVATQQWRQARGATLSSAEGADRAVQGYRLAQDARSAIKGYTQPQLAIEALLVSWRALHVQSGRR